MDSVFSVARPLARLASTARYVAFIAFVLFCVLVVRPASATTQSEALDYCQQEAQSYAGRPYTTTQDCVVGTDPGNGSATYVFAVMPVGGTASQTNTNYWDYQGPVSAPCSDLTNSTSWVQGKVLVGYYTSVEDGSGNLCRVDLEPVTPPMSCGSGNWCTLVEYNPQPGGPDPSPVNPPGSVDNGNGQPAQPSVPDYPASGSSAPSNPPPTICGGGSCYDPSTGNACAVGPSGQVCVNVANSSGSTPGGCASSGSTTVCAGNPPPSPVGSQGSTITDPATQIQGSDGYTSANPSTGASTSTTVNVFSSGGSTSSGATSGSVSSSKGSSSTKNGQSGPASSSSTGNGDSFNGGGDCNSPPVCQGDAVMCGVAQEQWRTMCEVHTETTALAGSDPTKQPPNFASDSSKYGHDDVWQKSTTGNTVGDAANSGTYDQSGFGFSTTCPFVDHTFQFFDHDFVYPFSFMCGLNPYMYYVIIGMALTSAVIITAGGRG